MHRCSCAAPAAQQAMTVQPQTIQPKYKVLVVVGTYNADAKEEGDNSKVLEDLLNDGWHVESITPMSGAGNGQGYKITHACLAILYR